MMDVIIIGGGICGCSLLYQLSRYDVNVALLEKENDVGVATTKANSAIVHAGYDPEPGTLMARYNVEGNRLIEQLSKELDIPFDKCGSLVVGFDDTDKATLTELYNRGIENGVPGLKLLDADELHEMEPNVSEHATCALYAETAGVISPWELAFAQAEAAIHGGAEVYLDTEVTAISKIDGGFEVVTNNGTYECRYIVNAAGTHADLINAMLGEDDFHIKPAKGEYYLLDTAQGGLVNTVVFPCPSDLGKGVLVSPTVHGNIIVGPDSTQAVVDDLSVTRAGLDYVREHASRVVPAVDVRASIRNFAGLRSYTEHSDFIVGPSDNVPGYYRMAGIKSPGLTSAPAIGKDVARMLVEDGLSSEPNPNFCTRREVLRFKELDDRARDAAIRRNPQYGTIVCRCETVTEGEIIDAMKRPLPPRSLDAVKRRLRPGSGRCQGGFCGPRVQAIIARELEMDIKDVPQDRQGMYIITGTTKGGDTA